MATPPLGGDRPVLLEGVTDRVIVALGPVQGDRALSNSTIVVGKDATLIIDTMVSTELVEPVRLRAEEIGGRPVTYVINTHGDRDHIGGNGAFGQAKVVTHKSLADDELLVADVAFEDTHSLDLGGVEARVTYVGPAHSKGDSFVWLPSEAVAVTGDVVFNGLFPLIREDIQRWLLALDMLEQLEPRFVVPGHGPVGDARTITWQRRMIEDVFESVKNRYSAGVPVDDASQEAPPERFASLPQAENRWPGAVRGIYQVLDDHTAAG